MCAESRLRLTGVACVQKRPAPQHRAEYPGGGIHWIDPRSGGVDARSFEREPYYSQGAQGQAHYGSDARPKHPWGSVERPPPQHFDGTEKMWMPQQLYGADQLEPSSYRAYTQQQQYREASRYDAPFHGTPDSEARRLHQQPEMGIHDLQQMTPPNTPPIKNSRAPGLLTPRQSGDGPARTGRAAGIKSSWPAPSSADSRSGVLGSSESIDGARVVVRELQAKDVYPALTQRKGDDHRAPQITEGTSTLTLDQQNQERLRRLHEANTASSVKQRRNDESQDTDPLFVQGGGGKKKQMEQTEAELQAAEAGLRVNKMLSEQAHERVSELQSKNNELESRFKALQIEHARVLSRQTQALSRSGSAADADSTPQPPEVAAASAEVVKARSEADKWRAQYDELAHRHSVLQRSLQLLDEKTGSGSHALSEGATKLSSTEQQVKTLLSKNHLLEQENEMLKLKLQHELERLQSTRLCGQEEHQHALSRAHSVILAQKNEIEQARQKDFETKAAMQELDDARNKLSADFEVIKYRERESRMHNPSILMTQRVWKLIMRSIRKRPKEKSGCYQDCMIRTQGKARCSSRKFSSPLHVV